MQCYGKFCTIEVHQKYVAIQNLNQKTDNHLRLNEIETLLEKYQIINWRSYLTGIIWLLPRVLECSEASPISSNSRPFDIRFRFRFKIVLKTSKFEKFSIVCFWCQTDRRVQSVALGMMAADCTVRERPWNIRIGLVCLSNILTLF